MSGKYQVVVTYKNGSTILIDVPENYYNHKYAKKSELKLHKIFMKEYKKFVSALNLSANIVNVGKYLTFSNATISAKEVLGVDLKTISEINKNKINESTVTVPGVHDKTYLDISETSLDAILKKLETTNIIENLDLFIKKVTSMMSKNNVEFIIKAGAKKKTSSAGIKKSKVEPDIALTNSIKDSKEIIREDNNTPTIEE